MKRLVIGVVIAALSLAFGSTAAQARAWDPEHPPVWVPVTAEADRPSGDADPWNVELHAQQKQDVIVSSYWWMNLGGRFLLFIVNTVITLEESVEDDAEISRADNTAGNSGR